MQRAGDVKPGFDPRVRPPSDLALDLRAASRGASDPTAARILDAASSAVRSSGIPQLRVVGDSSWPESVTGTFKRRLNADGNVTSSFVPSGGATEPVPVNIDGAAAEGIANNAQLVLRRDPGGITYSPVNLDAARACSMVARIAGSGR